MKSKGFVSALLILFIVFSLVTPTFADLGGEGVGQGGTFFTDSDNWGGGAANTAADGDLDSGLKNQNKSGDTAGNYAKFPFEFKITNVNKVPVTSAYLLVRALDVDEEDGEWDRVYGCKL